MVRLIIQPNFKKNRALLEFMFKYKHELTFRKRRFPSACFNICNDDETIGLFTATEKLIASTSVIVLTKRLEDDITFLKEFINTINSAKNTDADIIQYPTDNAKEEFIKDFFTRLDVAIAKMDSNGLLDLKNEFECDKEFLNEVEKSYSLDIDDSYTQDQPLC